MTVNFDERKITCLECGWTGTGSGAIIEDRYQVEMLLVKTHQMMKQKNAAFKSQNATKKTKCY
jgi:hypothetical protein